MKCNECNTIIKKKYKSKHDQSKEHKYFADLVLNTYVIKGIGVNKFKDTITLYYNEHTKKFDIFTFYVYFKVDDEINYKISVPNQVVYAVTVYDSFLIINETACVFLHRDITNYLDHNELPNKIRETEIVFISDLKNMTFS